MTGERFTEVPQTSRKMVIFSKGVIDGDDPRHPGLDQKTEELAATSASFSDDAVGPFVKKI